MERMAQRYMGYRIGRACSAALLATGVRAFSAAYVTVQDQQPQRHASATFGSNSAVGGSPFRQGLPQGKAEVGKGRQGKERLGKGPAGGTRAPPKSATLEHVGSFREEFCKPGV